MTGENVEKRLASAIEVREFRLLYQWPLVLEPDGENGYSIKQIKQRVDEQKALLTQAGLWEPIPKPIEFPAKAAPEDGGGYGEFVYFHDFAQSFLYPTDDRGAFCLFKREDILELRATFPFEAQDRNGAEHRFKVERLTLHMFKIGIAILTLELRWTSQTGDHPLDLAQAQRIIDYLRRSYTPFWFDDGTGGRVPTSVTLVSSAKTGDPFTPPERASVESSLLKSKTPDAKVFGHWVEMINPLKLLADDGPWRDPSDERIPLNSFIGLDQLDSGGEEDWKAETRAALLQIRDGDWHRIMDADEPDDDPYAYNPASVRPQEVAAYYDRFYPDPNSGSKSTRHLFGGVHYAMVGAGGFFNKTLLHHWRRHYAQLSLIARFEMTALLAVSSRISKAVKALDESNDEAAFDRRIMEIQHYFLRFVHQFRFTGVTSQLQGAEMYDKWRETLHLDALFVDVKTELDTATAAVIARQQLAEASAAKKLAESANDLAGASNRLAMVASIGIAGGLIVGALGSNVIIGTDKWLGSRGWSEWGEVGLISGVVLFASALLAQFAFARPKSGWRSLKFWLHWPMWIAFVGVLFVGLSFPAS